MMTAHRTALMAILVMTPLAIGGVRSDIQLICAVLVGLTAMLAVYDDELRSLRYPWIGWILFVPALWTCVQLVPLPMGVLASLSPEAANLYLATDPALEWAPLTIDRVKTYTAAIHQVAFALLFLIVLMSGRTAASELRWAVISGATLCSAVGLLHWVFDADRIYGLYSALHRETLHGFFGPFVNENTLASLLVLGCLLGCGKLLSSDDERTTWWALVCTFLCGAGVIASGSRGGLAVLVIGWFIFAGLAYKGLDPDRPTLTTRVHRLLIIGSALLAVGIVTSFMLVESWEFLWRGSVQDDPKIKIWQGTLSLFESYWATGSGRGTFGLAFHQHQAFPVNGTITHAENYLVQSFAESGVLATVVFACVITTLWILAAKTAAARTSPSSWASFAGVTAVSVHQLADFGMESMGVSFAVATALGTLLSVRRKTEASTGEKRLVFVGVAMIVGLTSIAGLSIVETQSDGHLASLRSEPINTLEERAQQLASLHPADPMIPLVTASRLHDEGGGTLSKVMRWAGHAQRLGPRESQPHLVLARSLARLGLHAQASGEYRRALEKSPWSALTLLREVAQVITKPQHHAMVVGGDPDAERRLVQALFNLGQVESVRALSEELLFSSPSHQDAPVYLARACLRLKDVGCVRAQVAELKRRGRTLLALGLGARIEARSGQNETAALLLEEGWRSGGDRDPAFLEHAVQASILTKDPETARKALDHLWTLSEGRTDSAVRTLVLRGRVESSFGETNTAIRAYEQAYILRPTPLLALAAARLEVKTSQNGMARTRLLEAQRQWPQNRDISELLERLIRLKKTGTIREGNRDD